MHDRIRNALQDMVDHAREVTAFVHGKSADDLLEDRVLRLAMERDLEIIGEAASRVPDFMRKQVAIDWRQITGLRNVISHRYDQTDVPTMMDIIEDDLPPMVAAIQAALEARP